MTSSMSSQAQNAASESSSDSSASSVSSDSSASSADDGENVFGWDENFTTWKRTLVSAVNPQLLVMSNPFFWLLLVLCLALVGGVGVSVALTMMCQWNLFDSGRVHRTLGKYAKILYRGKPPGTATLQR